MLIIQIPVLIFAGSFVITLICLYAFVKIAKWHYQTKALKIQDSFRRPISIDRDDAWQSVKALHERRDDGEM